MPRFFNRGQMTKITRVDTLFCTGYVQEFQIKVGDGVLFVEGVQTSYCGTFNFK